MSGYELSPRANERLDAIYVYGVERWGEAQAEAYVNALFDCFGKIARGEVLSKPIPAEFGVDGHYRRHARHFIYWRRLANGAVGIVTVLHDRMHRIDRFKEDAA